ncbi:MAG: PAS domain S-box protein [Ignavibacteria bacterium]
MKENRTYFSTRSKIFTTALLIAVISVCILFFKFSMNQTEEIMKDDFLQLGIISAHSINTYNFSELSGSEEDLKSLYYQRRKEQLSDMRFGSSKLRFLYLLGKKADGTIFIYMDSEPVDSKDYSPPGQVYYEFPQKINQVFTGITGIVEGPYTDRWGKWVSVFVPVFDHTSGKVIAVLGMDIDAKSWDTEVFKKTGLLLALLFLAFILSLFVYFLNLSKQKFNSRQKNIVESAEKFSLMFKHHSSIMLLGEPFSGRIIDANKSASDFYGYSDNELKNMTINDISILTKEELKTTTNLLLEKEKNHFILQHRISNGKIRTVEIHSSPIELNEQKLVFSIINDITDRKITEDALKDSLSLLEATLETTDNGILVISSKGTVMKTNSRFVEMWGIPSDILVSGKDAELMQYCYNQLNCSDESTEKINELHKDNTTESFDILYLKDERIFERQSKPIVISDNSAARIWFFHDITERHQASEKLKESEENFRTFFETIDDMIFIANQQGQIFFANGAVFRKLGYSIEELNGMHVLEVHQAEKRTEAESIFGDMFAGKRDVCPLPLVGKYGSLVPVETRVWFGKWGGKDCIFGISKDISKEQEALQKFNKLFDGNPALMAVTTIPGRIFSEVNEAFIQKTGYSRDEIINRTAGDLQMFIQPEKQEHVADELQKNGHIHNYELKVQTKNKELLDGLFSGEIIESQGKQYFLTVMIDITERKRAEEALRESEQKFRTLANSGQTLVWAAGTDKLCYYFNRIWLEFTGRTLEQEAGNGWAEGVHPGDFQRCLDVYIAKFDQREKFSMDYRLRRYDGQYCWIEDNGTPTYNSTGEFTGYIGQCYNISKRKRAEESLRESNQKWEAIISASPDGIGMISLDGKLQLISNKLADMYGYSREEKDEVLGKQMLNYIDPSSRQKMLENIRKLIAGEREDKIGEYLVIKKDNSQFYVELNSTVLYDSNGSPVSILFAERDITERKKNEQVLQEITNRLSLAVQAGGIGIWDYDVVNDKLLWDEQMYLLYGIKEKNFGGAYETWRSGLHPEDMGRRDKEIQMALSGEKDFDTEFRVIWEDGTIHNIRAMALVQRDSLGNPLRMIGTNWDVTPQKQIETKLKNLLEELTYTKNILEKRADELAAVNIDLNEARIKAIAANIAKSMFIANVSHEIRTPMNAILGFSEILLSRITEETAQGYLKTIFSSGKSLLHLINDILDLSKIEAGKMELELVPTNLKNLIKDIVLLLKNKAEEKGLELLVDYPPDFPQSIITDEIRIRQILVNIVGNALKFTKHGYVKIAVVINKFYEKRNIFDFSIIIEDTGIGISENEQQLVFESFGQARQKAGQNVAGTGLGLSISNRLTELMGGNITLESKLNEGSKFTLNLKAIEYFNHEISSPDESELQLNNVLFEYRTILIIDDVVQNIEVLKGFLAEQPFTILEGYNGKEAIEMANKYKPDIIFMDIRMPEMDGLTATGLLKKDAETNSIPVIAFTASLPYEKNQNDLLIFDDSLFKPIFRNKLFSVLMKFIPYTIVETEKETEPYNNFEELPGLPDADKAILKKAVEDMESVFENKVRELSEIFDLDEIDVFINNLDQYINMNKISYFDNYLKEIKSAKNGFDIEIIQKLLKQFSSHIQKIKINL